MPLNRNFAEALVRAMSTDGWSTVLPAGDLPNPLELAFTKAMSTIRLLIHARQITPQERSGVNPSTHNRPAGELHTQMIFDGDKRGSRATLRFLPNTQTVLFGFFPLEATFLIAAYDPQHHLNYAYSKSLQVKEQTLQQAAKTGIAFQIRKNGETVVAFPIEQILAYLQNAEDFHSLTTSFAEAIESEEPPLIVKQAIEQDVDPVTLPELVAEERRYAVQEVGRYIRNHKFAVGIKLAYDRCAICGFQYDYVLDAAHIVPVPIGTDTYDNGLGLCPNCHRMFDKGLILVDENRNIYINPRYAEEYEQMGRAGSLESLRQTLRATLWLPNDEKYHPSSENLRRTFEMRR